MDRSTSQVMARSKSYPLAANASSSSEGASVAPNTELRTSNGVMPSVSMAATSGSISSSWFCEDGACCTCPTWSMLLPNICGNGESSADSEELEIGECPHSRSSEVLGWKERGNARAANGSKGSSSSSSGRMDARNEEVGVPDLGRYELSGVSGAAMANLDVGREGGAHKSGEGVSARSAASDPGLEEAAERGRGMGLNSDALALSSRGDDMGEDGRLTANWACVMIGDTLGESLRADMYEEGCACVPRGDVRGVCGRRNIIASGELGAELGVSGRLGIKRAEWVEAREEGREMGRRVGVRKRKGTLSMSSLCLCMRSRTCCSSYVSVSGQVSASLRRIEAQAAPRHR